jgi:hypothetical protein
MTNVITAFAGFHSTQLNRAHGPLLASISCLEAIKSPVGRCAVVGRHGLRMLDR